MLPSHGLARQTMHISVPQSGELSYERSHLDGILSHRALGNRIGGG